MMKINRSSRLAALIALPLLVTALAGCAAAADGNGETEAPTSSSDGDLQTWSIAYSSCMRDEGLDYPEPPSDPSAGMPALNIEALGGMDAFNAADEVCRTKLGEPPLPAGTGDTIPDDEETYKRSLKLAQCLRDQGVEVADPAPGSLLSMPPEVSPETLEACGLGSATISAG